MSIRIQVVDDHKIMREGLIALLEKESDLEVVAEAGDGEEAVRCALNHRPDLIVMDLTMPKMNGLEATRRILAAEPAINVLALSMVSSRAYVVEALKAGVKGYLLKECAAEELVSAIRTVASGDSFLDSRTTELIMKDYARELRDDACLKLSTRECEVLQLIADGKSTKTIAFTMGVCIKTVETHRMNVMKKLDLFSIAELTKYAIREGLTSLG